MRRILAVIAIIWLAACGVDRKKVGDRPPQFAFAFSEEGKAFGHMAVTGGGSGTKSKYGNSFSMFLWPEPETVGSQFGGENYHKLILYMKKGSKITDTITQIQFHDTIAEKYTKFCKIETEKEKNHPPFDLNCSLAPEFPLPDVSFKNCGPGPEDESDISKESCKCLQENKNHVMSLLDQLGFNRANYKKLKSQAARCLFEAIDPYVDRSENWLMGDFKKKNGDADESGETGSRLSIIQDANGNPKVIVDLVNFDGFNYTSEDPQTRKRPELWGRIENAVYDRPNGMVRFDLIEKDGKNRVFKFELLRTWPNKSMKDFNKLTGEVKVYKEGKLLPQRGQATFLGYLSDTAFDMDSIWDTLLSDK